MAKEQILNDLKAAAHYLQETKPALAQRLMDHAKVLDRTLTGEEEFCPQCVALVEPESRLTAQGLVNICPECGVETIAQINLKLGYNLI